MHALGGPGQVFISAAAMDLGRGGAKVPPTNLSYGRKSAEVIYIILIKLFQKLYL